MIVSDPPRPVKQITVIISVLPMTGFTKTGFKPLVLSCCSTTPGLEEAQRVGK